MNLSASTTHLSVAAASSCTVNGTSHYQDFNHRTGAVSYGSDSFALAGTTGVAVVDAPDAGVTRHILAITCAEVAGTPAAETLTFSISTLSGSTYTPTTMVFKAALAVGAECIFYSPEAGWVVTASVGERLIQVAT